MKHITPTEIARLQEISRRFEKVVGEDQVWAHSVQDCSDVFVTGRLRTARGRLILRKELEVYGPTQPDLFSGTSAGQEIPEVNTTLSCTSSCSIER